MRRQVARWTAAAGLALSAWSSPALADGLTNPIELTNNSGQTVSQVIFEIVPAGAVVPANSSVSPLVVIPGYPDETGMSVALGEGKSSTGGSIEAMRLGFGLAGFKSGDSIEFELNTASSFQGVLPLPLLPPNSGLTIQYVTPTTTGSGSTGTGESLGGANTPEPLSILVWSGLSGLGFALRHRRKVAAANS